MRSAKASAAAMGALWVSALALVFHATVRPAWGIVVSDDPSLHVITAPSAYDAVARLSSTQGATGVLIDPWYVLTAKHAVAAWPGHTATFYLAGGSVVYSMAEVFTHPTADVAVIRLNRDTGMDGYSLYDPNVYGSETGKEGILLGYGMSGTPDTVQAGGDPNYPRGTLRIGYQRIDAIEPSYGTRGQCLRTDFDSPSSPGPYGSLGADKEAMIALGDSGAPVFIEAGGSLRVAGLGVAVAPYDPSHWPKYGDYGYAVRVSAYTSWIDSVIADIPAPLTGDFNNDTLVNATDIDALFDHFGSSDLWYDVSGDGVVGWADSDTLIRDLIGSEYGDTNLDGWVDGGDLAILGSNWMKSSGVGWAAGDFNGSGMVDGGDLAVLGGYWNWSVSPGPSGNSLPEPATLALLSAGAMGLIRRRR